MLRFPCSLAPRRRRAASTLAPVVVIAALTFAAPAGAAAGAEEQLAERYAPIVALKQQAKPCDTGGEAYRPVPVETVLGRADVRLVDSRGTLLRAAPTAADLFGRPADVYLDFPGSPLQAGCRYERWFREIAAGAPTTAYAHIVTEPGQAGRLALQYWLYYPFNDFNNKHESDWEMIQLLFDADTAAEALGATPTRVGYSQHEGAEEAAWDDEKLERSGDHPVVYPGAGSHANYFQPRLWLGHSAQEGFGCDDTRGPTRREQAAVVVLPDAVARDGRPDGPFAWLTFEGHWGQRASGPNTGPTGPNVKGQWREPVSWAEDEWRSQSSPVPLTKTIGTSSTSFFCSAVAAGSRVYLRFLRTPWTVLGTIALVLALAVWLSRRTRWSPGLPTPLRRTRAAGEIFRAALRLYRRSLALFLGIGIVFLPLSVVAIGLQEAALDFTRLGGFVDVAEEDPIVAGVVALVFGSLSTITATALVAAATAHAVGSLDAGGRPDALSAYRGIVPRLGALAVAWLRIVVTAGVLIVSIVGIPFAIVYLVRRALVTQAAVLEERPAGSALARSGALVRRRGWRVLAVAGLANTTALLLGPIVGILFLFLSSSSLAVVNGISSVVYAIVMPYVGLVLALLFHDLRERAALGSGAERRAPG